MTKKYQIEIVETIAKTVEIKAKSESDAILLVKERYQNEDIVLGASNHAQTTFKVTEKLS